MLDRTASLVASSFAQFPTAFPLASLASITQIHFPKPPLPLVTPIRTMMTNSNTSAILSSLSRTPPKPTAPFTQMPSRNFMFQTYYKKDYQSRDGEHLLSHDLFKKYRRYDYASRALAVIGFCAYLNRKRKMSHLQKALTELELTPNEKACVEKILEAHHFDYIQEMKKKKMSSNIHNARTWVAGHIFDLKEDADKEVDTEETFWAKLMNVFGPDHASQFYKSLSKQDKKILLSGLQELEKDVSQKPQESDKEKSQELTEERYKQGMMKVGAILQQKNEHLHKAHQSKKKLVAAANKMAR